MDVLMPQLGETVAEGKITKWFKSAGDAIKPGDNLFEIETDKVSMEVPSTTAGVLAEIRVGEGEVAPVGAIVAVIADGAGAAAGTQPAAASAPAAVPPAQASPPPGVRTAAAPSVAAAPAALAAPIKLDPFFEVRTPTRNYGPARLPGGARVTPLARRLAAEGGIDLGKISPSGPHGRIVARDVEAARAVAARAAPAPTAAAGVTVDQVKALYRDAPYEEVPLDGMRKTIAARLVMATQTIPHFYLTADVEIGALIKLREEVNAAAPKDKAGNPTFRLSVNDLVIKAWAAALQRVPAANAVRRRPRPRRASPLIRSRRSTATRRTRRCRSTACARPSPRGW
jgi:pyruvate dehydrogenase E2 component (dihydrolipoyllysine-residue acetyltransferase)